jgi:hypothetical protein
MKTLGLGVAGTLAAAGLHRRLKNDEQEKVAQLTDLDIYEQNRKGYVLPAIEAATLGATIGGVGNIMYQAKNPHVQVADLKSLIKPSLKAGKIGAAVLGGATLANNLYANKNLRDSLYSDQPLGTYDALAAHPKGVATIGALSGGYQGVKHLGRNTTFASVVSNLPGIKNNLFAKAIAPYYVGGLISSAAGSGIGTLSAKKYNEVLRNTMYRHPEESINV